MVTVVGSSVTSARDQQSRAIAVASPKDGSGNAVVAQWICVYSNSSEGWSFLGHNAHGSLIPVGSSASHGCVAEQL